MSGQADEPAHDPIDEARDALRRGDAVGARASLAPLLVLEPSGEVLELEARAAYVALDYDRAIEAFERAYATYRAADDRVAAVRTARTIAPLYGAIRGDWAVGSGWLARAQTVLADADDTAERGWVALNLGMFEGERDRKHELFGEALAVARAHRDVDLEVCTLAYLGASMVHADRTSEGMRLLDEALAAVAGSEVDDFCIIEEVFCQLFSACEHASDVARADQWIGVGDAIAQRRGLPAVSAFCRTHYGGVLTVAGRWDEADEALTDAIRLWALGRKPPLRAGAVARLADLRARQGRFDEAEQLLDDLDPGSEEVTRPWAAVHLSKGEVAAARDLLASRLAQCTHPDRSSASMLELLVEVHLVAGDLDEARAAAEQLTVCVERLDGEDLRGALALARGRIALATGAPDAARWFDEAATSFRRAQRPIETAHARLASARARSDTDLEGAIKDARKAHDAFVELGATRHADAASALLRSLGVKTASPGRAVGTLTKREQEVLELVGLGLSNPEIADRLFISRKTVEHHVGNVLGKLGLRSRAEAAAYVVASGNTGIHAEPGPG